MVTLPTTTDCSNTSLGANLDLPLKEGSLMAKEVSG